MKKISEKKRAVANYKVISPPNEQGYFKYETSTNKQFSGLVAALCFQLVMTATFSRVMFQRKKQSLSWEIAGHLARIASPRFVISNSTMELLPTNDAIKRPSIKVSSQILITKILQLSLVV